jgi:predicted acetyltransferase
MLAGDRIPLGPKPAHGLEITLGERAIKARIGPQHLRNGSGQMFLDHSDQILPQKSATASAKVRGEPSPISRELTRARRGFARSLPRVIACTSGLRFILRYKLAIMQTHVVRAARSDQPVLQDLLQLYAYDFSEILRTEVGDNGRFPDPPLDAYWRDAGRFPFLLRADGHLAGFALVHRGSRISNDEDVWDMAEFFVLRRHRRAHVGMRAAHHLFAMHPGRWEIRQRRENTFATLFWRRAVSTYTNGSFSDELLDDAIWQGPVQRFTSGRDPRSL